MRRVGRARPVQAAALLVLLLAAGTPDVAAFTPAVRAEIARRTVRLMPPALARQLRRHLDELRAGALEGVPTDPATPAAHDPGESDRKLAEAIERAVHLLDTQAPMSEVARAFGRVARVAADLSFALNSGPDDPREAVVYADFARYVERKMPKIRPTFAGFTDPHLARGDVTGFARATAELARRDYDGILASYFPAGRRSLPQDFDDRSVAFAAASLEVSLALTTTARTWLFAWHSANGDLTGTPFLGAN